MFIIAKKKCFSGVKVRNWDYQGSEIENPGDDLDIPGAELDDANENIGEEDEENNYYSLGGDNHEDLEEDKN